MKDKWINIGYEGEELKPYTEPEEDFGDTKRIGEGVGGAGALLLRGQGRGEAPQHPPLRLVHQRGLQGSWGEQGSLGPRPCAAAF